MSVRNSDLSATVPGYMAIVIEVLNYAWQYRPAGVWGLAAMGRRWEARRRRSARVAPPLSPRLGGHAASAGRAWRAPGLDGTRRSENRCPLTSPAKIKNWLRLCANVAGPECLLFTPKRLPGDATERRSCPLSAPRSGRTALQQRNGYSITLSAVPPRPMGFEDADLGHSTRLQPKIFCSRRRSALKPESSRRL